MKRIPEIGSSLGRGIRDFKRSLSDLQSDVHTDLNPPPRDLRPPAPRRDVTPTPAQDHTASGPKRCLPDGAAIVKPSVRLIRKHVQHLAGPDLGLGIAPVSDVEQVGVGVGTRRAARRAARGRRETPPERFVLCDEEIRLGAPSSRSDGAGISRIWQSVRSASSS